MIFHKNIKSKLNIIKCLQFSQACNLIKILIKCELFHSEFNKVIAMFKCFTKDKRSAVINLIYSLTTTLFFLLLLCFYQIIFYIDIKPTLVLARNKMKQHIY
jgi:hypothetical protein